MQKCCSNYMHKLYLEKNLTRRNLQHTTIVHVNEKSGQHTQVAHTSRAQRDQQIIGGDDGRWRGTHGGGLLHGEVPVRLATHDHHLGCWEHKVLHQLLGSR